MPFLRSGPGYEQLAQLRDEGNLEALARYLNEESGRRVRRRAATYIASLKPGGGKAKIAFGATDPAIIPILAPLLERDPDPSIRRSAAYGLRRTGDESAVPALLQGLSDKDKATRIHAAMGLGDLRARAAVGPLSKLLEDRSCAATAARSLVEIGDERGLVPLRQAASTGGSRRRQRQLALATSDLRWTPVSRGG